MLKRILPVLIALGFLLTACGPQGTPTLAPVDVENTAIAVAWTIVAMTQAAIPTATPVPPTETPSPTPLPTFTPFASPTLAELILPTATQAAVGECGGPLNVGQAGPQSNIRIENESGGTISTISLGLSTNLFGQCGWLAYSNIGKGAKQIVSLPKGSWYAYAWITYKDGTSSTSEGSFVLNVGYDDLVSLIVRKDGMVAK